MTQRREFIAQCTVATTALWVGAAQAAAPLISDSDPQAIQLGYKSDASKVDKTKFPKFAAGQICANCALYLGKSSDAAGMCPLFAGKQVAAKGWCGAYAKKA